MDLGVGARDLKGPRCRKPHPRGQRPRNHNWSFVPEHRVSGQVPIASHILESDFLIIFH